MTERQNMRVRGISLANMDRGVVPCGVGGELGLAMREVKQGKDVTRSERRAWTPWEGVSATAQPGRAWPRR